VTTVEFLPQRVVTRTAALVAPVRIWALWLSAVVATSWASVWIRTGRLSPAGWLDGWHNMDVEWYVNIARYGYESPEPGGLYTYGKPAFFPLMPALMRALHAVTGDWVVAGLIVSVSASAIAAYLLWRLVRALTTDKVAVDTTAMLFFSPFALYFFVPYTESLFLALMLGTFLAMRSGRWGLAGGLAAFAAVTRPTGSLLIVAIAVEWFVQRRRARGAGSTPPTLPSGGVAIALPLASLLSWEGYLWSVTGRWDSFSFAETAVWLRHIVDPLTALVSTIRITISFTGSGYQYYWFCEILSVLLGFVLTYVLARRGYWSWATFIGLNTLILSLSSYYGSGTRAVLTWSPAFVLLAIWLQKRPRLRAAYFAVSAPLMLVFVTSFTAGNWVA
jgi:hypothetical protein